MLLSNIANENAAVLMGFISFFYDLPFAGNWSIIVGHWLLRSSFRVRPHPIHVSNIDSLVSISRNANSNYNAKTFNTQGLSTPYRLQHRVRNEIRLDTSLVPPCITFDSLRKLNNKSWVRKKPVIKKNIISDRLINQANEN